MPKTGLSIWQVLLIQVTPVLPSLKCYTCWGGGGYNSRVDVIPALEESLVVQILQEDSLALQHLLARFCLLSISRYLVGRRITLSALQKSGKGEDTIQLPPIPLYSFLRRGSLHLMSPTSSHSA